MTNALAWLNDLMQWFGRWVPRLVVVAPTHRAVVFGPRGAARERGPGLVVYWPVAFRLVQIPITTQSLQLCAQVIPLQNDPNPAWLIPRVRILKVAVQYRAHDAVAVATRSLYSHAIVDNRAKAIIATNNGRPDFDALKIELARYGMTLERFDVVGDGVGVVFAGQADWAFADRDDGTGPGRQEVNER